MDTTLEIKRVPIDSIRPDPANVRLHDDRNLETIKSSLARFGQQKPIVVDRRGIIRAGNGTYHAAKALGWHKIQVVVTDLEGLEATAYAIADNRSSDLSSFDSAGLAQLLDELRTEDALLGVGYSSEEIDELLDSLLRDALDVEQDAIPELPDEAATRSGDLWALGRHRLLCGDSAFSEDVDRLVAGAPIHLINMDPPYGVKVEPRSNNAIAAGLSSFSSFSPTHHQKLDLARHPSKAKPTTAKLRPKDRPLQNDFLPEEEFEKLLRLWFANAARVLLPGRSFYVWGGYGNLGNYPPALKECGLYFSQGIVWNKLHPVLTRKDFMGAFEIAYSVAALACLGLEHPQTLLPVLPLCPIRHGDLGDSKTVGDRLVAPLEPQGGALTRLKRESTGQVRWNCRSPMKRTTASTWKGLRSSR